MLDDRPPGTTTIDAIREFFASGEPPHEHARLRRKVATDTPALQMRLQAQYAQLEPMLVDLGAGPDDMRPLLIAASMMAALKFIRDRLFEPEAGGEPMSHEQEMAILDQVLEFTRAGLEALQRD